VINAILFFAKICWKSSKKYFVCLFSNEIIGAILPFINIVFPKFIIDELTGERDIAKIAAYTASVVAGNWVFSAMQGYFANEAFRLRVKVSFDFTVGLSEKLEFADYGQIENPEFLNLKQKAEHFIYGNWNGFGYVLDSAISIISKAVLFFGIIAIIATLSPLVVAVFIFLVLASSLVENWVEKKCTSLYMSLAEIERRGMYLSDLFSSLNFAKEIRLNVMGGWLLKKLRMHYDESNTIYSKVTGYRKSSSFVNATSFMFQNGIAYAYLIKQILARTISIGSFYMYLSAVGSFTGSMREVMSKVIAIKQFQPYYQAVNEFLNIKNILRKGNRQVPDGPHRLEFCNVSFGYVGQEHEALSEINFSIESGEKIALVGENGSGKTTMVKLLTRLYDPTRGKIILDGIDIREFDYDQYMSVFSVVFQDFSLFSFSVKENIALARCEELDDDYIYSKLVQSGLKKRIDSLKKGIHTSVYKQFDNNGFEPSGGEGQKIALARALCKDSSFVILDEPASALDPKSERDMYERFDEIIAGKSAVYISHRLSSCRFCDKILVLKNGRIVETGTHSELMQKNSFYAELFNLQAEYYVKNLSS
jgi:ATP-binding cassette subfamily B protein/ATP-binding cassette subfamily C protein